MMTNLLRRQFLKVFSGTALGALIAGVNPDIHAAPPSTSERWGSEERPVDCRSYHMERLKHASSVAEVVYLEKWTERQTSIGGSSGLPTIWFLRGEENHPDSFYTGWLYRGTAYLPTTVDEERMAAAFAQWLGTNCGLGFIIDCEQEIARREGRDPYIPLRRG